MTRTSTLRIREEIIPIHGNSLPMPLTSFFEESNCSIEGFFSKDRLFEGCLGILHLSLIAPLAPIGIFMPDEQTISENEKEYEYEKWT